MGSISTRINPAVYLELPVQYVQVVTVTDGEVTGDTTTPISVAPRPGEPVALQVRDAETGVELADTSADGQGMVGEYDTGTSRAVEMSTDSFASATFGPFLTREVLLALLANLDAADGLADSVAAAVGQASTAADAANAAAANASSLTWSNLPGVPTVFDTDTGHIGDAGAFGRLLVQAVDQAAAQALIGASGGGGHVDRVYSTATTAAGLTRPTDDPTVMVIWYLPNVTSSGDLPTLVTSGVAGCYAIDQLVWGD